jgi:molecular chaperone HtpG
VNPKEQQVKEEKHEFKAEVSALLRLVTNSLYTNREIFLRELISNASDALDKVRFQGLTDQSLRSSGDKPGITLRADAPRGVLVIEDNGVGMTRDEISLNLGTIAHSGTLGFLERVKAQQDSGQKPDLNLIGQFGVGFYSAFMVADRIDVESLGAHPDAEPVHWSSTGDGTFTVRAGDRTTRGTRIELHLKSDAAEFLDRWRLDSIIRKYSNYVMHPITLQTVDKDAKEDEAKQVNEATAFWTRSPKDLTEADYKEFYKHVMGGFVMPGDEPLGHLHISADAPIQFVALLYIPGKPPADLFMEDRKSLQLFARRVLVIDNCDKLLPPYLRFVRGVVDSEDLPLNVSREMLQEHNTLSAIRRQLTRKVLKQLDSISTERPDDYVKVWDNFGAVLKEGLHTDQSHQDELVGLLRFRTSTSDGKLVSLADYVAAMPEGQEAIYYITGESVDAVARSPHLEACAARGYQVLFLTDPIDEWVVQDLPNFKEKPLRSVTQGDLDLKDKDDAAKNDAAIAPVLGKARELLTGKVKDVRASKRLRESASCLVDDDGGLSRNMERILKAARQNVPTRQRILELNPDHPFVQSLSKLSEASPDDARVGTYIELLYDQAALAEGVVSDPAGMVKRIQSVLDGAIKP